MNPKQVKLGINLDHVATLRQVRGTPYPDFGEAIRVAERAGGDGITIHLREDRRHVQDADVMLAKREVSTTLNLEMAATDEMVKIACALQPDFCCIVPERREELTTEGGLDVGSQIPRLREAAAALAGRGVRVALFVEPSLPVIDDVMQVGAAAIELHTGRYADAADAAEAQRRIEDLVQAAEYAAAAGLLVNAGHGLRRDNVAAVAAIAGISELNIGHAVVADAVFMGLDGAVRAMKAAMCGA